MKSLLIGFIRIYQLVMSPFLGGCCRFTPSCSEYGVEAIRQHGWFKGLIMSTKRVCRCHPFHPGGVDPVPMKRIGAMGNSASASR